MKTESKYLLFVFLAFSALVVLMITGVGFGEASGQYAQPSLEPAPYQVNWDQARVDIASEVMAGMLAGNRVYTNQDGKVSDNDADWAAGAVTFTDSLIAELKKRR